MIKNVGTYQELSLIFSMLEFSDQSTVAALRHLADTEKGRALTQFHSLWGAQQYRRVYALVRKLLPAGAEVLDWGCGNGHFSYFLQQAGHKVQGFTLDPYLDPRDLGLPAPYILTRGAAGDATTLPYADASFDAVFSIGVLEHVRELGGTETGSLSEIRRVLRPGGLFVCDHLPNWYSWVELLIQHWPGRQGHVYRYTKQNIRELFSTVDMHIESMQRFGILPRNIWSRWAPSMANSESLVDVLEYIDASLGFLMPLVTQNFLVVAQRPH